MSLPFEQQLRRLYRRVIPRVDPHQRPHRRGTPEPPRSLPGLFGRVHADDLMIGGASPEQIATYRRVGEGAADLAGAGLAAAGRELGEVRSLLDFGCGYGRVTRVFAQRLAPEKIAVFDVDPAAAAFCGAEFGVQALSFAGESWDWSTVPFGRYDWIWVGSVLTHLDEPYTRETLALLISLLEPGGVLVFTTHGDEALRRCGEPGFLDARIHREREKIRRDYAARGFHFTPLTRRELAALPFEFRRGAQFGYTWMSEAYTRALAAELSQGRLEVKGYRPAGWEGYQDAVFCQLLRLSRAAA